MNIKRKIVALSSVGLSLLPTLAFAQSVSGNINRIDDVFNIVEAFITRATPFLIGLAVFVIIFGVFKFILNADNEEERKAARYYIFWGVIGVFVMISIWGLVNILSQTFNLSNNPLPPPQIFP
jgi:Na+/proline symporter